LTSRELLRLTHKGLHITIRDVKFSVKRGDNSRALDDISRAIDAEMDSWQKEEYYSTVVSWGGHKHSYEPHAPLLGT
jgi:hypothetical protein